MQGLLGGSWAVITGLIIRVTILISHIRGLVTPLITSHEPSSRVQHPRFSCGLEVVGSFLGFLESLGLGV